MSCNVTRSAGLPEGLNDPQHLEGDYIPKNPCAYKYGSPWVYGSFSPQGSHHTVLRAEPSFAVEEAGEGLRICREYTSPANYQYLESQ